jgi:hypothetical protein
MLMNPVVLPCRHTYCLKCFEENSVVTLRCPLCRQEVEHNDVTPAKTTQNIIEGYSTYYLDYSYQKHRNFITIGAERGIFRNGKM